VATLRSPGSLWLKLVIFIGGIVATGLPVDTIRHATATADDQSANASHLHDTNCIGTLSFPVNTLQTTSDSEVISTYVLNATFARRPMRYSLTIQWRHLGGRGVCGPPPRSVKCKSFALSVSSKGSLYISHNGR